MAQKNLKDSGQPSAISYQLTAISRQLSAISNRQSAFGHQFHRHAVPALGVFVALFLSFVQVLFAHPSGDVDRAIEKLKEGRLEDAESALQKARFGDPGDPRIRYNLGIVNYRKKEYAAAVKEWHEALTNAGDPMFRASILHNLGNAAYRGETYDRAVEAYKASLELNENPETRYNLEQAQKKLDEERERQQKQEQKEQQGSKDQDQKKDGKDSKDSKDSQGDQKQGQDNKGSQDKSGKDQSGKDQQGKDGKPGDDKKDSPNSQAQNDPKNQTGSGSQDPSQQNASESADPEKEQERRDLAIPEEKKKEQEGAKDASQRARGIKNTKLNPYAVEKLLKDMEEREKEVQLRYRNEPHRQEDLDGMDPFFMDAEQLREFFERRRGGKPKKPDTDSPDW